MPCRCEPLGQLSYCCRWTDPQQIWQTLGAYTGQAWQLKDFEENKKSEEEKAGEKTNFKKGDVWCSGGHCDGPPSPPHRKDSGAARHSEGDGPGIHALVSLPRLRRHHGQRHGQTRWHRHGQLHPL